VWSKVPLRIDLACLTGRYPNDREIGTTRPLPRVLTKVLLPDFNSATEKERRVQ